MSFDNNRSFIKCTCDTAFTITWIFFWFFTLYVTINQAPTYNYKTIFFALMEGQNDTNTTQEVKQDTILTHTCDLWNNEHPNVISYNFSWWPASCQLHLGQHDHDKFVLQVKIFIILKFIGVFLFTTLFVWFSIKFSTSSKVGIAVIMTLYLISCGMDVSALKNDRTLYEFAFGEMFNISGQIFSDYSNNTLVTNQFDFTDQLCNLYLQNQTLSYVTLETCDKKGINYLQSGITVMPLTVFLMLLFTIIGLCRGATCYRKNQYIELV